MFELTTYGWPLSEAGVAMEHLARASGLMPTHGELPIFNDEWSEGSQDPFDRRMMTAGALLDIEVDPVYLTYGEARDLVTRTAPALLRVERGGRSYLLALLKGNRRSVTVLRPDLKQSRLSPDQVCRMFCEPLERPHLPAIDTMLKAANVPTTRQPKAARALLLERLSTRFVGSCWVLRPHPGRPFKHLFNFHGLRTEFLKLVFIYAASYAMLVGSWWLIGRGALSGVTDMGWLLAWALLQVTRVPLRIYNLLAQGDFSIGLGVLIKKRLMLGALRLNPEQIRNQGAGQLLSRVLESETIEHTVLEGGFAAVLAVVELIFAAIVVMLGAAANLQLTLLLLWFLLTLYICKVHFRARGDWADKRLEMTHDLIEKMVGHRTRLAQESRERWHLEEDREVREYIRIARSMDVSNTWMMAVLPQGWLAVGMIGLAYGFISGLATRTELAIALGGVLLAHQAFSRLVAGWGHLTIAGIAWGRIAPLFAAAAHNRSVATSLIDRQETQELPLIQSHNLGFNYARRGKSILSNCDLTIRRGDRLLLQGPSGCGKSTLASILTNIRDPDNGLLLYRGLDPSSVGTENWRKKNSLGPQFHENHVFTETFLFNLLMGCRWPPIREDQQRAEQICHELGLGDLLARMPSGMLQMVGETGWQLSHGEKSRLFIARALLQQADLIIFDESFAALDPENLQTAMRCVFKHAPTALVIAHP